MADKLPKINPNISKYKNDLGLSTANIDAMQNMATVPTLDQAIRQNYLNGLGEGDLLTEGVSNFLDGKASNVLHDYNSYNYVWSLYSLSADQLADSTSYVGKVFSDDKYWGYESSSFYTVLRSGGYARSSAESLSAQTNEVNLGSEQAQMLAEQDAEFFEEEAASDFKTSPNKSKDLFIDNVQIENYMGNSPSGIGNLATGTFAVTEPFGVGGFYEELLNAAQFAGHENYQAAPFLLTLSFIGRKVDKDDPEIVSKGTRYWPIMITGSKMKVTEAGSTYQVKFAGVNYQAGKGFNALTSENINGPRNQTPTVGRLLLYVFQKHNEIIEKQRLEAKGEGGYKRTESTDAAYASANTAAQSQGLAGKLPETPWAPDRYCIWFPKAYGTAEESGLDASGMTEVGDPLEDEVDQGVFVSGAGADFPSELKDINYTLWQNYSTSNLTGLKENYTDEEGPQVAATSEGTAIPLKQFSNYVSSARMKSEDLLYTGVYEVPEIEARITANTQKEDAKKKEIAELKAEIVEHKKEQQILQKEIDVILSEYLLEKDEKGKPIYDPKALTDEDRQKYEDKNNELLGVQVTIDSDEAELKTLTDELTNLIKNKNTLEQNTPVKIFGTNTTAFQFKKGVTLENIIHQIILDSTYAKTTFAQEEKWNKILSDGMIPWYRLEKFAKIVAFDPARNAPVYEYHYVVAPFQVHYSKLPGANAPLKYDYLKNLAVREYNYIFTGKNLDIMGFDIDYNNLFFVPVGYNKQNPQATGKDNETPASETIDPFSDIRTGVKNLVGAPQNQMTQATNTDGGSGKQITNAGDTARLLHDRLYNNTSDLLTAQLEIIGDPVYLVSSGIANRPKISAFKKQETSIGEVNTFDREVTITLNIAYPGTDVDSGDMPNSEELAAGKYAMPIKKSRYSGLYRVTKVMSRFEGGQFIQTLQLARFPNQKSDYEEEVEIREPKFVEKTNPKDDPSPQEEIDKAVKDPEVKLDGKAAENLEKAGGFTSTENLTKIGSVALGAVGGFALGGPLGAVAGAAVGGNTNFLQSVTDAIGSGTSIPVPGDAEDAVSIAQAAETVTQSSNIVDDD